MDCFIPNSPQGDGNPLILKKSFSCVGDHCFIPNSPQGDGNFVWMICKALLKWMPVSYPIPRKGTETWSQSNCFQYYTMVSYPIPRKGTKQYNAIFSASESNLVSSPIPRKGTETRLVRHLGASPTIKTFHTQFPARGRKLPEIMAILQIQLTKLFHTQFPARGRKP